MYATLSDMCFSEYTPLVKCIPIFNFLKIRHTANDFKFGKCVLNIVYLRFCLLMFASRRLAVRLCRESRLIHERKACQAVWPGWPGRRRRLRAGLRQPAYMPSEARGQADRGIKSTAQTHPPAKITSPA